MLIENMTRKELENLPVRKWGDVNQVFSEVLIFPNKFKHDSGYTQFTVIGLNQIGVSEKEKNMICSICSDDINWINPKGLQLQQDSFYKSKTNRFWSNRANFKIGDSLSSIHIELIPNTSH